MGELLGYNGRIAFIDLSTGNIDIQDLDPKIAEDYIGGVGLSAKLLYDRLSDHDFNELKRDVYYVRNPIIFATGPLTGTLVPSSSRYSICGISPLTGVWGESTSGGYFPLALKRSGYDALVITGEATNPTYIHIIEERIELKDARFLWGKDCRETINELRMAHQNDKLRVACIGQAGENLVKYAAVINDEGRAAGRCGFGALMGKKNLKAISILGSAKLRIANQGELTEVTRNLRKKQERDITISAYSNYGTMLYTDLGMLLGDVPGYYFTETEFPGGDLTTNALRERYTVLKYNCAGCQIGCGKLTIAEIDGNELKIDGPEYETVAALGTLLGIFDLEFVLLANHLCNIHGVDTISSGVSIAFLIYLIQHHIAINNIQNHLVNIKLQDIRWGNKKVALQLLTQLIERKGIGDLLAEGTRIMAEKLGVDPELAAHCKGLEIPMHDPRAYEGQALSYMTCPVGANHNKGDFFNFESGMFAVPKARRGNRLNIAGREASVAIYQDLCSIYDSLVICNFTHTIPKDLAHFLKLVTGLDRFSKVDELMRAGERATNLKRLINSKLGISRSADKLPKIVINALKTGATTNKELKLEDNLKKYYEIRGWDLETGIPTPAKLQELNIR